MFSHSISYMNPRISHTQIVTIKTPSLFTMHKRHRYDLNCLNTASRIIVLMYYLNQQYSACDRTQVHLVSHMILSSITYFFIESAITGRIIMQISSSTVSYKNTVSASMTWENHFLIIHISRIMYSVTSETTGDQFMVEFNPENFGVPPFHQTCPVLAIFS